jgi:hypothetical protein
MYKVPLGGKSFIRSSCDVDRNTHYYESEPQTVFCIEVGGVGCVD